MRKLFLIALVTLGASFQGGLYAVDLPSACVVASGEIDAATLERIFEAVACETGSCVAEVRALYADDAFTVEKEGDFYVVKVVDGGGLSTILIEEGI